MTDTPTPGPTVKKAKKIGEDLPEPPTFRQLKEAEMERDTALASAERSAAKVGQLRIELKRAAAKALREKEKLAAKLQAEIDQWRGQAEAAEARLAELEKAISKDAKFVDAIQAHAGKDEPTKGCACPACQVLGRVVALRQEVVDAKKKYRETKETLNSFQGPRSKRKGKRS